MKALFTLTLIDEHHLHDSVQWNIDLVRAHAVGSAIRWAVVSVAELLGIDLVVLREEWCRRGQVRNFIDQRNYVISGRGNCRKDRETVSQRLNWDTIHERFISLRQLCVN